jgi:hypoxanthine-DNA glycosylase
MGRSQQLTGLPPVIAPGARLLILGSMPGAESLRRGEYYAHPRNVFWDLIELRLGIPRAARGAGVVVYRRSPSRLLARRSP